MKNPCCTCSRTFVLFGICILALLSAGYAQTFTVSAAPSSITLYPGQQNVPITVTIGSSAYAGPITVTLTGLPTGVSVSPLVLTAGTSGTLNVNAGITTGTEGFPNSYPSTNTSWTTSVTVLAAAGTAQATAPLNLTVSISNPSFAPDPAAIDLPIMRIDTNGVAILDKNTDIPGTIAITSPDGKTTYLPSASNADNTANLHVHGSSTSVMPKLAYHVKFTTSLDLLTAMGMKCPYVGGSGKAVCDKSKSYILLANYVDKTFVRNWSAYALANAIPMGTGYLSSPAGSPTPSGTGALMPWASHSLFVELYINGVYEGNYQLIEQIKVDSHRVNINSLKATDTDPAQITGGYLLEIDHHQDEAFVFHTPQGLPIGLNDPDFTPNPEVPAQTTYISNYVNTAETALFSANFTDPTLGWRAYFDETAAINWYIVNDVMGNIDGGNFYSSDYLYKSANNPLLYMGPVWDFDISSGNVNYFPIVSPLIPWAQTESPWYVQWFKDPGFKADTVAQWNMLMKNGVFSTWLASIPQQAAKLERSQANNFGRWPVQGLQVWPNNEAAGSYDGEVAYLTNWLALRIAYLDSQFNSKPQTSITLGTVTGTLRAASPATLTAQVAGGIAPGGALSFLCNGILLGTSTIDASGAASLTTSNLQQGNCSLQAVYHGDANTALSTSSSQMVTVAAPLVSTITTVAGPIVHSGQDASTSFVASVIANSPSAVPTGNVIFSADGGPGTAVALNGSGQAVYTTTSLTAGQRAITASYAGSANHSASTGAIIATIVADFMVAATPATVNVNSGQSGVTAVSVTPQNGFSSAVSFTCSGLPVGASCSFSPATVTPAGAAANTTLTIVTTRAVSFERRSRPLFPGAMFAIALCGLGFTKRRRVRMLLMVGAFALSLLNACGGGGSTPPPPVTSTITVTATSGSLQHSTTVLLTVR